jgi:LacI family transcriptional regulator
MIAKGVPTVGNRVFGATRLTRRASSRILPVPDAAVRKALEFIRLHACEGIGPRDVVKAMGISRTQADLRFRAAVRHTLLDEIHLVRLARAKELVARGIAPAAVADRCGYSSLADLQRVFRRRVGMTMRAWARETV